MTDEAIADNDAFRIAQLNSLLAVDDVVATVISALEEIEELDNTVIVFASDQGYLWDETNRITKSEELPHQIKGIATKSRQTGQVF